MSSPTSLEARLVLVFRLGAERFGVPASQVEEIIAPPAITRVPGTGDWVLGVFNLRGDIMGAVDVRGMLGQPPGAVGPSSRLVVLASEEFRVAVLVDSVEEIASLEAGELVPAQGISKRPNPHAKHVFFRAGKLVSQVDLVEMLAVQKEHALA